MQPYFVPYAGYFRLFAAAELFVIYDCVQFPRRGWVHRNRLLDRHGKPRWLTLSIEKSPRETSIGQIEFRADAAESLRTQLRAFPSMTREEPDSPLATAVRSPSGQPADYISNLLGLACDTLGLPFRVVRSSSFSIPAEIRGQDRIIEIVRRLGAKCYLNSPGGRALYDRGEFLRAGAELLFLAEYRGSRLSILERLASDSAAVVAREIASEIAYSE